MGLGRGGRLDQKEKEKKKKKEKVGPMQEPMLIKWGPLDKLKRKTKSFIYFNFFFFEISSASVIRLEQKESLLSITCFLSNFRGSPLRPCSSLSQWWSGGLSASNDGEGLD